MTVSGPNSPTNSSYWYVDPAEGSKYPPAIFVDKVRREPYGDAVRERRRQKKIKQIKRGYKVRRLMNKKNRLLGRELTVEEAKAEVDKKREEKREKQKLSREQAKAEVDKKLTREQAKAEVDRKREENLLAEVRGEDLLRRDLEAL